MLVRTLDTASGNSKTEKQLIIAVNELDKTIDVGQYIGYFNRLIAITAEGPH